MVRWRRRRRVELIPVPGSVSAGVIGGGKRDLVSGRGAGDAIGSYELGEDAVQTKTPLLPTKHYPAELPYPCVHLNVHIPK